MDDELKDRSKEYLVAVIASLVTIACVIFAFCCDDGIGALSLKDTKVFLGFAAFEAAVLAGISFIGNYRLNLWFREDYRDLQAAQIYNSRYERYCKENEIFKQIVKTLVIVILALLLVVSILWSTQSDLSVISIGKGV